jgi:hypothetical protein
VLDYARANGIYRPRSVLFQPAADALPARAAREERSITRAGELQLALFSS